MENKISFKVAGRVATIESKTISQQELEEMRAWCKARLRKAYQKQAARSK